MASKIKQFCIDHLVSILLVAIAITLALSAVGAWAKYTETLSSTTSIKLSIVDYTIDKAKMHKVMQGLSTKPTTVKFVKGTEVPTGLTNLATTTATGNSVAGIQQDDASMIGVFQSTDGTTLYIAPMNAPADGDTTGAAATAASNEFVMHTPTDSSKFLYGWGADAGGTGLRDYLTAIDVGNLDTSRTTDMRFMFGSNALVTSISNLSVFDTSNVTTMANMFNTTNKLTDFDVSGFNTSNVTSMTYMFANCNVAKTIDVSKFDTSKLESAYRVFYMCNAVEKLDFSSWNTNACTNMEQMFSACYKLSEVTLSKDFKWVNGSSTNGPLPTPNSTYITGATGSWYDTTSGDAYTPSALAGVTRTETRTYTAVPTYTIDKSKIQTQLRALAGSSTVPTAIKFVKGNDSAVSGLTNLYEAGIQDTNEKSAKIAIYQDGTTVYIAPADKNDSKSVMYAPKDCSNFLNGLESYTNLQNSLTTLELSNLDTSKVTTMSSMFNRLSALTSLDVSGFDTKNVTNMDYMFYCDSALTSLNVGAGVANTKFDTSNVTSMQGTFGELTKLTTLDISNFNTAKVKSMFYMFNNDNDSSLTTITFDTTKFDTSNVTNMQNMFKGCNALSSLDVSGFNTTKVTTMQNMFNGCKALKKLDVTSFDTSKVTKFDNMFNGCMYLTELDTSHFKAASNVTQTNGMFTDCQLLASIDLSNFSTTSTTNMANMFSRCYVLQSVTLGENFDFVGTNGYLPTPSSTYIANATGKWKDTVTSTTYTPADLATFHNTLNRTREYVVDTGPGNYWLAAAGASDPSASSGILKTQAEIDEDMAVLHGTKTKTSAGKDKAAVTSEWEEYMNGTTRLYTAWKGSDASAAADKWVEFRIIQVGAHDNDGSAVTFMATHSLPTAQRMNVNEEGNTTSWSNSGMRATMNDSNGYVMTGLSDLANATTADGTKIVKSVQKMQATYDSDNKKWNDTASLSENADTFWLLSFSEIAGENTEPISDSYFRNEGSQYAWFTSKNIDPTGGNTAIANMDKTRSGASPAGYDYVLWWERSPFVFGSYEFGTVVTDGDPSNREDGDLYSFGVVPAFSF